MQLVSGRQSLSAVSLDPPAAQTGKQQDSSQQQQQDQQHQTNGSSGQDVPSSGSKPTRVTYKVTPTPGACVGGRGCYLGVWRCWLQWALGGVPAQCYLDVFATSTARQHEHRSIAVLAMTSPCCACWCHCCRAAAAAVIPRRQLQWVDARQCTQQAVSAGHSGACCGRHRCD